MFIKCETCGKRVKVYKVLYKDLICERDMREVGEMLSSYYCSLCFRKHLASGKIPALPVGDSGIVDL